MRKIESIQNNAKTVKSETIISYLEAMRDRNETLTSTTKNNIKTLFIASKNDSTIPFHLIPPQAKKCNTKLISLEKSGHMSFIEEEEKVVTEILKFLN